jgi:membrane-associated phospholipid phosphatase
LKYPNISRLLIILIISASFSSSFAQKSLSSRFDSIHPAIADTVETFKYTILNLHTIGTGYADAGKCTTSPLHWKGKDWLKVLAFAGAGLAIHQLDEPINNVAYNNNSGFTKGFSKVGETIGSVVYILPTIGATYLFSRITGNDELSGLTITAGKAVVIANTFVTYSKILAHRHRPNADTPSKPNQWDGPRLDLKDGSFISSHTASSFALATVIASYYADKKWVPPIAYTLASLVAVSRIAGHDHFATDVFAGAVIGYSVGKLVYKLNRSKKIKLIVTL